MRGGLTYLIRPGPGKYGEVLCGGLVGVVGDVRQVETADLIVPVPHHLLHTGLPDLPVVLSFEGDQVLGVLGEKHVMRPWAGILQRRGILTSYSTSLIRTFLTASCSLLH